MPQFEHTKNGLPFDPLAAISSTIGESLRLGAAVRLAMIEQGLAELTQAARLIITCFQRDGKLLLFGNRSRPLRVSEMSPLPLAPAAIHPMSYAA